MQTSAVINQLRESRNFTDLLHELRKESFEERIDRVRGLIEEENSGVLLATFACHAIYEKGGKVFRAKIVEDNRRKKENRLTLGLSEEVEDISLPSESYTDLQEEVLETARATVEDILGDADPKTKVMGILQAFHTSDAPLYDRIALESARKSLSEGSWWRNFLKTSEKVVREHLRGRMDELLSEGPKSRYDFDSTPDQLKDKAAQLIVDLKYLEEVFSDFDGRIVRATNAVGEELSFEDGTAIAEINFKHFVESLHNDIGVAAEITVLAQKTDDLVEQAQTYEILVAIYPEMVQAVSFVESVINGDESST